MREQTKAIFVWYPKARIDLKMIHDENDELVVARNKHACIYEINFLVDFVLNKK